MGKIAVFGGLDQIVLTTAAGIGLVLGGMRAWRE
jgi:hypothetical protein